MSNPYSTPASAASYSDAETRSAFIMRTYHHLFGAIFCLIGIEILAYKTGIMASVGSTLMRSPMTWLMALGAFMVVSWLFSSIAHKAETKAAQYGALAGYTILEALILMPLLWVATTFAKPEVLTIALWATLLGFAALTAVAFITRKDFSFLRGVLMWGGIAAVGLIVGSLVFGFSLGMFFSIAMIIYAGGAILYETSNIMHHYPKDRHVAASVTLLASVAMLFWYVLSLVMEFAGE